MNYIVIGFCFVVILLSLYRVVLSNFILIKNISNVSRKIYKFKKSVRYYPIIIIGILSINMYSQYIKINTELFSSDVNAVNYKTYLQSISNNERIIFLLSTIFIIISVLDLILSFTTSSNLYEEGILLTTGRLINWDEIASIDFKKTKGKKNKVIRIVDNKSKNIEVISDPKDYKSVLEVIYNKSGMVAKDIMITTK